MLVSNKVLRITKIKSGNILEVGGGSGALSLSLAEKINLTCSILDNQKIALEYAALVFAKKNKVNLVEGNAEKMQFCNDSFDLVHSVGLIEHYKDSVIEKMIFEMKRVVKKDGYIFLAVPNYFSPDLIFLWWKYGKGSERHISIKDLKKYVEKNNLTIIDSGHSSFAVGGKIGMMLPKKIEKFIGQNGFGFLNYVVCKKK